MTGKVYLVGAGPGDPGLITVKGQRRLAQASVVLYDRLLDPSLLDLAPASAERVFVGKERGRQAMTQDEINQFLIVHAHAGQTVVRLKGGDPFVFGRGGEEALALAQAGIPFEIVPGVTSAVAALAYAGIPITHRRVATCFTVVSGSEDPAKPESSIAWDALARTGGTLVVLMGWAALENILARLRSEGMAQTTPVALVQWGTWPQQRVITGALDDIVAKGRAARIEPPVIAVVGSVVNLREQLAWFDKRPLFGKKVLITRARTQASRLRELLEEQGAQAIELPSIEIAPLDDYRELDSCLSRLHVFTWMIFNSVNAVDAVFARLERQGKDARALGNARLAAIGPATAEALARHGLKADFMPARSVSEDALDELLKLQDWMGVMVFIPSADIGREVLAQGLARQGAQVEQVAAYHTVVPGGIADRARAVLQDGVDIVTFTSASTVRNLISLLDGDKDLLEKPLIACIGPMTADMARGSGLRVDLMASEHRVEGLVSALVEYFRSEG